MKTIFSKGLKILAMVGLFALILGTFLASPSQVKAQAVSGWILASPSTICAGESSTISWATSDATSITITPSIGSVAPSGERTVSPTQTTTYTMTISNSAGGYNSGTATVTVTGSCVIPPTLCLDTNATNYGEILPCIYQAQNPTVSISANPTSVEYNGMSVISWSSANATSCTASGGVNGWAGSKSTAGTFYTGALTNGTTFNITCYGASGTIPANGSATVSVNSQPLLVTVAITASPSTVCNGNSSSLNWSSTNATSISISSLGSVTPHGNRNVYPSQNTTYTITGTNSTGGYSTASVTVYVSGTCQLPTPTVSLVANPTSIQSGGNSTLTWTSTNAASCFSYWTNSTATSGTGIVVPGTTTTYTTTCTNGTGQQASSSATVYVTQAQNPTVSISANPTSVEYNGMSVISWSSTNATSCTASGGVNGWAGSKSTAGTFYTGALTNTNVYNITCTNSTGQAYGSTTVSVNGNNNNSQANVSISADRTNIAYNENTIIRWYPNNATSCYGSAGSNGWAGPRSIFSDIFYTGALTQTTTYTISCNSNNGGSDVKSVTVNVGNQTQIITPASTLTAVTTPATEITTSSAQLNALILNSSTTGYIDPSNAWFEWGPSSSLGNKTSATSVGALSSTRHSSFITGLTSGKTYYFRAVAENSAWRNVGSILTFVTNSQSKVIISTTPKATPTSLVLISSFVDRNQPIVPTIDNSKPRPGDEINYTVSYQNIGNASITNLNLRVNLPYEVDYISSSPNNPIMSGNNNLTFNLGTLKANGQGVVTIRVRVRDNIPAGTNLNFPATLSYIDPSGSPQLVSANVSAQVWSEPINTNPVLPTVTSPLSSLGANVFGAGFLPTNIFGWLLLLILVILLVLLARYVFGGNPFNKKTTTVTDQPSGKKTTTTTLQ